jgi:serine/threonine-protein kinase HipA
MKLTILANERAVGELSHEGASNRYAFAYAADWLAWEQNFALAPALPLTPPSNQTPDQHSAAVRQFFQNLLPEGQALEDAASTNGITVGNVTGLLLALGKETAGALRVTPADASAPSATMPPRPLSRAELSDRIQRRPEQPFSVWDGKVRLSIAGYQDKLAVYEEGGDWFLVESPELASTRILKPEPLNPRLAGMTTNEMMCMLLAQLAGVPAANVSLEHVPQPVLVIERFDRRRQPQAGGPHIERVHCIDGCQALGLPVEFKYERPYGNQKEVRDIRDGSSLRRFFALLDAKDKVVAPAASRLQFLRWVILQVLIGNTDAHAKNVSFFSDHQGLRLAPAYDLVSTLAFGAANLDHMLAMAIGDNFDIRSIKAFDWAQMANENALQPRLVQRELQRIAKLLPTLLPKVFDILAKQGGDMAMAAKVAAVVQAQCQAALAAAAGITAIAATNL